MLKKAFAIFTIMIVLSVTVACGAAKPTSEAEVAAEPTEVVKEQAEEVATSLPEPTAPPTPTETAIEGPAGSTSEAEVAAQPTKVVAGQGDEMATPPPEPTAPPIPTEVVSGALTTQEFYNLALAIALEWQPDALLSRVDSGALNPLDSEGKGEGWSAQFYSPSAKEINHVSLINGEIKAVSNPSPTADIVPDIDAVNLDVKSFYDAVAAAAGSEYAEGYDIIAGLRPDVLDNSIPAWTFIYQPIGKPEPSFAVIIDARSGKVLRAGQL